MSDRATAQLVDGIRDASRRLVRELGFMGAQVAGSGLSPSAVHALIEIEGGGISARDLSTRLHLEKSSVSRMLRRLIESGDIQEQPAEDGRVKVLALTNAGQQRVAAIHQHARSQVSAALARLAPGQSQTVLSGLQLYAEALAEAPAPDPATLEIVRGYRTGLISSVAGMQARYYARETGFGVTFESVVAGGLAEFCPRLGNPANGIWTVGGTDRILGSVAIDGEDLGEGKAHLRWFYVEDELRGTGMGRRLLQAALDHVDTGGFDETHLWTFSGLDAARHLYESFGFVLVEEQPGAQWGKDVLEQRFVRPRP